MTLPKNGKWICRPCKYMKEELTDVFDNRVHSESEFKCPKCDEDILTFFKPMNVNFKEMNPNDTAYMPLNKHTFLADKRMLEAIVEGKRLYNDINLKAIDDNRLLYVRDRSRTSFAVSLKNKFVSDAITPAQIQSYSNLGLCDELQKFYDMLKDVPLAKADGRVIEFSLPTQTILAGHFFQYPPCCINYYVQLESFKGKPHKLHAKGFANTMKEGGGYVPCYECAKKMFPSK